MKASIYIEDDEDDYDLILTDDHLDNSNFVEMIIKGENQYLQFTVPVKDLYDLISLFHNRRST